MFVLASEPAIGLVVGLGIGMVFFGLICIIVLCYILGAVIGLFEKNKPAEATPAASAPAVTEDNISQNGALMAAIAVAIAEDMGTDISAIRIKSIKKL